MRDINVFFAQLLKGTIRQVANFVYILESLYNLFISECVI